MTARWCAGPGRRHRGDVGSLCVKHLDQLGQWLHDVQDEPTPDVRPSLAISYSSGGGAPAFEQTPVRLDALVLTDPRRGTGWAESGEERRLGKLAAPAVVLDRWAWRVVDGRGLTPPPGGRHSLTEARQLLTRHLDWCAEQPWIGRMYRAVGELRNALVRVNGGVEDKPLPGSCPRQVKGEECGGPLWPAKPKHTSGPAFTTAALANVAAVECGDDPTHRWEGRDLARLSLIVAGQRRRTITRKESPK